MGASPQLQRQTFRTGSNCHCMHLKEAIDTGFGQARGDVSRAARAGATARAGIGSSSVALGALALAALVCFLLALSLRVLICLFDCRLALGCVLVALAW